MISHVTCESDCSLSILEALEIQQVVRTASAQELSQVKNNFFKWIHIPNFNIKLILMRLELCMSQRLPDTYHSASLGVWVGDWEVEVAECPVVRELPGKDAPAGVWS